jgi:hypothetical protein
MRAFPKSHVYKSVHFALSSNARKKILSRVLPKPSARLIDVDDAAGAYSVWLADQGVGHA